MIKRRSNLSLPTEGKYRRFYEAGRGKQRFHLASFSRWICYAANDFLKGRIVHAQCLRMHLCSSVGAFSTLVLNYCRVREEGIRRSVHLPWGFIARQPQNLNPLFSNRTHGFCVERMTWQVWGRKLTTHRSATAATLSI